MATAGLIGHRPGGAGEAKSGDGQHAQSVLIVPTIQWPLGGGDTWHSHSVRIVSTPGVARLARRFAVRGAGAPGLDAGSGRGVRGATRRLGPARWRGAAWSAGSLLPVEVAELIGTVVFAISGVIAVAERRLDWFGAIVVGVVTAIGGGTMRGLILGDTPVFWIEDEKYLASAVMGSILAIPLVLRFGRNHRRFEESLQLADALGLALFAIVSADITLSLGFNGTTAVVCGILSGVGGGVIRDLLAGQTPLIMRSDIYATAALAGTTLYVLLVEMTGLTDWLAAAVGMVTIFGLRMAGLKRDWSLPTLP